jgi:hypothetical protein
MNWLIHKGSDSALALPILSSTNKKIRPFSTTFLQKGFGDAKPVLF